MVLWQAGTPSRKYGYRRVPSSHLGRNVVQATLEAIPTVRGARSPPSMLLPCSNELLAVVLRRHANCDVLDMYFLGGGWC
jgi:hypothetical protein